MNVDKQPGIDFEMVFLKDLTFSRKPEISQRPELDIKLDTIPSFSPKGDKLNIEMSCTVQDIRQLFKIKCTMIGIFSLIKGSENMTLKEFADHHAPALIFPYLRETIASITAKSGIASVLLPPINLTAVKKVTHDDNKK